MAHTADNTTDSECARELLARVELVRPVIEAHAQRAELERRLDEEVYEALLGGQFFRTLVPRAVGGMEMHPADAFRVWEAISRIDSAAGWNLQISAAVSSFTAWLQQEGIDEIFSSGPDVVFAGALAQPAPSVRVAGGWQVSARTHIASGCHRADWFAVAIVEVEDAASAFDPLRENPPRLVAYIPRDEVDIDDTWFTSGMRGTFSSDVLVDDVFVPGVRVGLIERQRNEQRAPAVRSALYGTMPWPGIHGEALVSVAVATAAIEKLVELARRKTPAYSRNLLKDRAVAQHHAGKARALTEAARGYLFDTIGAAFDECERGGILSDATVQSCQLAACLAAGACADAVSLVHEAVGIHGCTLDAGFERHFRDIHTLTQHASKSYSRYEDVGQMMFGMDTDWFLLQI